MERDRALERLDRAIAQAQQLAADPDSPEFSKWQRDTRVLLEQIFGQEAGQVKEFEGISYHLRVFRVGTPRDAVTRAKVDGLRRAEQMLRSMRDEVAEFHTDGPPGGATRPVETSSPIELERITVGRLVQMAGHLTLGSTALVLGALSVVLAAVWTLAIATHCP